jgi:H+/gluconate symporter-like permease
MPNGMATSEGGCVEGISATAKMAVDYGLAVTIAVCVVGLTVYFALKLVPQWITRKSDQEEEDRRYWRKLSETMSEQIALSRQALETSNAGLERNNIVLESAMSAQAVTIQELKHMSRGIDTLSACMNEHDNRAIQIARDVAVVASKV